MKLLKNNKSAVFAFVLSTVFIGSTTAERLNDLQVKKGEENQLLVFTERDLQNNVTMNATEAPVASPSNATEAPVAAPVDNSTEVPSPSNATTDAPVASPADNTTDTTDNATITAPTISAMPSVSPPTPAPVPPTPRPTPVTPYVYAKYGESTFGYKYQSQYDKAFQLATRRPGWSWNDPLAGYAPFCYENVCYDISGPCQQYGGVLLNNVTCAFPADVKIAGPSCWGGNCTTSNGRAVCDSVGGITIGDGSAKWCLFKDSSRTLIGPACYGDTCYKSELAEYCNGAGGQIWNDNFCIIPGQHTVIGPVCWEFNCFAGSLEPQCEKMDGTAIAGRWCVVPGCDRTVVGPLCSKAEDDFTEECYGDAAKEICDTLKGVLFADFMCVVDGTDWTLMGPNVYGTAGDARGLTNRLCRELQDNIGGPFSGLETYNVEGRFCLIKTRVPPVGPFCLGDECFPELGTEFCEKFEGENLAGFMCLLSPEYQQGFGPVVWNGNLLPTPNETCVGQFCAIKFDSYDTDQNLRCPSAGPIPKAPTPAPPPTPPTLQPTLDPNSTAGGPDGAESSGATSLYKSLATILIATAATTSLLFSLC